MYISTVVVGFSKEDSYALHTNLIPPPWCLESNVSVDNDHVQ